MKILSLSVSEEGICRSFCEMKWKNSLDGNGLVSLENTILSGAFDNQSEIREHSPWPMLPVQANNYQEICALSHYSKLRLKCRRSEIMLNLNFVPKLQRLVLEESYMQPVKSHKTEMNIPCIGLQLTVHQSAQQLLDELMQKAGRLGPDFVGAC